MGPQSFLPSTLQALLSTHCSLLLLLSSTSNIECHIDGRTKLSSISNGCWCKELGDDLDGKALRAGELFPYLENTGPRYLLSDCEFRAIRNARRRCIFDMQNATRLIRCDFEEEWTISDSIATIPPHGTVIRLPVFSHRADASIHRPARPTCGFRAALATVRC